MSDPRVDHLLLVVRALSDSMVELCRRLDEPLPEPLQGLKDRQRMEEAMFKIELASKEPK